MSLGNIFNELLSATGSGQTQSFAGLKRKLEQFLPTDGQAKPQVDTEVQKLENYVEQLALYFRTVLELCLHKGVFTQDEFKAALDRIDMQDGKMDGKLSTGDL